MLTVNTGSMFSGKSTRLIEQGKRMMLKGKRVAFVKPAIDNRYKAKEIVTHDGRSVEAVVLDARREYLKTYDKIREAHVVCIDEIQFFDISVVDEILDLMKRGKIIYVSGLDIAHNGKIFDVTANLMSHAHTINKCHAVCSYCGEDAYISAKSEEHRHEQSMIDVGGAEKYTPLCLNCNEILKEALK